MARPKIMETRKLVSLPPGLAKAIEDFRFENRISSESEAIRRLIEAGLNATDKLPGAASTTGSGSPQTPQRQSVATEKPATRKASRAKPLAMSKEARLRSLRERSS
jgi:hypothetical protein